MVKNKAFTRAENSGLLVSRKNSLKITNLLVLFSFIIVYIVVMAKYCWTLAAPSDPCQYIASAVWKTNGACFLYLDRIMVPIGINIVSMFIKELYLVGGVYIGLVNMLILVISIVYCQKKIGFPAAFFAAIFLVGSFLMTSYATYVYADQTVALYSLIAFVLFFSKQTKFNKPVLFSGIFSSFAFLSKCSGVATALFFIIYLIFNKKYRDLMIFFLGIAAGIFIAFLLTCLFFGYHSLLYLFLKSGFNFRSNVIVRGANTNLVSYIDLFFSKQVLPYFVSLFILIGAYRKKESRNLYLMAISHIVILYLVYTFTTRGGVYLYNYVYTIFIFCALGMAAYIGEIFLKKEAPAKSEKYIIIFGMICCIFLIAGFIIGHNNDLSNIFMARSSPPLSIRLCKPLRWLYTTGPLIVVGMLSLIEYSKSKKLVILYILFISLWSSVYGGSAGIKVAESAREEAGFFYRAAPVLNLVPSDSYSIYVENWQKYNHSDRVIWIYMMFFDQKYKRVYEPKYQSQDKYQCMIESNIRYLFDKSTILATTIGTQILTDRPDVVMRYFPVQKICTMPWENITLTVVNIMKEPVTFEEIRDFLTRRNIVKNGSFENWTTGLSKRPLYWNLPDEGQLVEKEKFENNNYILKLSGDDFNIEQKIKNFKNYINKPLTLFAYVKTDVADKYRIQIFDGIRSSYSEPHSGSGKWELLKVIHDVDPKAKFLLVRGIIAGKNGKKEDIVYLNNIILIEGNWSSLFEQNSLSMQ